MLERAILESVTLACKNFGYTIHIIGIIVHQYVHHYHMCMQLCLFYLRPFWICAAEKSESVSCG